MKRDLKNYAKIGINHHCFFPSKDNPREHVKTLSMIMDREDIEVVDLTVPYGGEYRKKAIEIIRSSGKTVVYNGYLMPTSKIPLGTLSYTERQQILMLAKDQVDVAYECGSRHFMQSVGVDPGPDDRTRSFESLGEYIGELSSYMETKGDMVFLIELMDRDTHRKSLCGPSGEVMAFVEKLSIKAPNIGVVLDLNHIVLMKETFHHAFTTCRSFLRHVHLGNCIMKDQAHPWWGGVHPPIGIAGGEIDVPQLSEIFRILLEINYLNRENPGMLSLEIRSFPGKSVEETIDDNLTRIYQAWELV